MTSLPTWRLPFLPAAVLTAALLFAAPRPAAAVCVGDCNNDGRVSIADVQACVNLGAGLAAPACAAADQDGDGTVDANDVDACLQSFLDASTCPMVSTPAPTSTATATRTNPPATATHTLPPATATHTVPPATATHTPVPPPTSTNTPVPTATTAPIVEHLCALDTSPASDSRLSLFTEAFGAALTFPFTGGSLELGAGGEAATCEIISLNPVNIPAIGFVCIAPASGCPPGRRDCDGGTPLGIDVQSDGNGGACNSNAACATIATTACGGAANVLASSCTGFCSAGTEAACTSDAACLPNNGACNGPNPIASNGGVCQFSCVNKSAHGPSDAGDFQCNLGATLIVETGAPCNGTDILINVGQSCVPFSTQRGTSLVRDANFNTCAAGPPCNVPTVGNVNDSSGAPIACSTVDASTTTGIVAIGAVNFFGSALGDLATGLKVTCQ